MLLFSMGCQASPTPFAPVPIPTVPDVAITATQSLPSYTVGASTQVAPYLPYLAINTEDPSSVDLWIGLKVEDETLLPIPYHLPIGLAIDATLPPFSTLPMLIDLLTNALQNPTANLHSALANLGYPDGIQLYVQSEPWHIAHLDLTLFESVGIFLRPTSADNVALKFVVGQPDNGVFVPLPPLPLGYTIKEHVQDALRWNAEGLPYLEETE